MSTSRNVRTSVEYPYCKVAPRSGRLTKENEKEVKLNKEKRETTFEMPSFPNVSQRKVNHSAGVSGSLGPWNETKTGFKLGLDKAQ
jgi:hypothetical protein